MTRRKNTRHEENPLEKAGKENSEDDIHLMAGKSSEERKENVILILKLLGRADKQMQELYQGMCKSVKHFRVNKERDE